MAGGSGLAGMMSQLMQSPAMQQTANPGMKEPRCISLQCLTASPELMKILVCRGRVRTRRGRGPSAEMSESIFLQCPASTENMNVMQGACQCKAWEGSWPGAAVWRA